MTFYFDRFENRVPAPPLPFSPTRELVYRYFATISLCLGAWYISWRWLYSLNTDALWFALPLVIAETGAYIGLVLFTINLWRDSPPENLPPPAGINACLAVPEDEDRPVAVDVFFATYNEDPELVRLGIRDAKAMAYPHAIDLRIHVLDDGRRAGMRAVAEAEGVGYITRTNNIGFKAGNLRNAMEQTSGDFIVICDADTRPFPTLLARTLGYFTDPQVAWVQTPQWFYDLPEGRRLGAVWGAALGRIGRLAARAVESVVGPITIGADPFVNDPKIFYDIILRRRNWANAAFCCGAGSVHRREAVMEAALRTYGSNIDREVEKAARRFARASREDEIVPEFKEAIRAGITIESELTPYKFHVSEDIYTSIVLHSDTERHWRSVLHPFVESRMLSPQDLLSWTVQRFKYAGGSLDILFHDNPLFRRGLTLSQRLMYASTFWSYLGGVWNLVFILAPIVYLVTGIAPVSAYSAEFFVRIIPFLIAMELAAMTGMWGISSYPSTASYIAFFPVNLRALWTVLRGRKISFPVTPKDRQAGVHLRIVWPQLAAMAATAAAIVFGLVALALGFGGHTTAGVLTNVFWGLNNMLALSGIMRAAFWRPSEGEG